MQGSASAGVSSPPRRSLGEPRFALRAWGVEPLLRLAAWALLTAVDRAGGLLLAPFSSRRARRARRDAWATRAVARAVATLGALKGVFVKAGQFAAYRHDVAPAGATAALADLRDRVAPLPLRRIRPTVERELGAPLEALFDDFEEEPLGAASMAQVHRARLPSGEAVAVKVQYPWLAASLTADLAIVRGVLTLASGPWRRRRGERAGLFEGRRSLDAARLFEEFADGLRDELDFEREAVVAGEIAANLADDDRIVVPEVVSSHSSLRVLTVRYMPAIPITDRKALLRRGIAPRDVVEIVTRAYAKQVFVDGIFHADPHPGNLFVLDEPRASRRPRVLFVDFGLSRRLDPELRREIRQGLHALVKRDLDAFVAGMDRMGMIAPGGEPGVRRAVEQMFDRIGARGGALGFGTAQVLSVKDEAKALLQQTEGLQLPNDLLLFARTLTYVFTLGRNLAPDADLMRLSLPYLLRSLS